MTDDSIRYFIRKYVKKYLMKRSKEGLDKPMAMDDINKVSEKATFLICQGAESPFSAAALATAITTEFPVMADRNPGTFCEYCVSLHAACASNVGLSHAKVREYWLYRGPRQLFVSVLFICGSLTLQEALRDLSPADRAALLLTGLLALMTTFVMLYYRLPDSIRSGVCRSAHDHYVDYKKSIGPTSTAVAIAQV